MPVYTLIYIFKFRFVYQSMWWEVSRGCHVAFICTFLSLFLPLPLPLSLLKKIELCHHRAQVKGETVYLVPPEACLLKPAPALSSAA